MKIKVYQINIQRDHRWLCFLSASGLERKGIHLDALPREAYDEVYFGMVNAEDLDGAFAELQQHLPNRPLPDGFTGHSMSVSDVVEILTPGDTLISEPAGLYFVDSIGFKSCKWA